MYKKYIRDEKQAILDQLAKFIIEGNDPKEFYLENKEALQDLTPFEVFNIYAFLNDYLPTDEIIKIAGKLVNLFRNGLTNFNWNKNQKQIKKLLSEGKAIKNKFSDFKECVKASDFEKLKVEIKIGVELKKRFFKMQNVIFSQLESKNINPKPLQVMWNLHDKALELQKQTEKAIINNDKEINTLLGKYFFLVLGIIEKEELLLLPALSTVLTDDELNKLERELDSYGYAFISDAKQQDFLAEAKSGEYLFVSEQGSLTLDELIGILSQVGDITFVDSNNKVKFFNTPHGHFMRSTSIIGRDVRNCHPSKSIHIVNEIIDKFRSGEENKVDFWINFKGRLILISYFAIRNKKNEYLGVMELTQDITEIKTIEGEKRILDFKK